MSKTQIDILVLRKKIAACALQVVKAAGMLPRYRSRRFLQLQRPEAVVLQSLDRPEAVVLQSLDRPEAVVLQSLDRPEAVVLQSLDRPAQHANCQHCFTACFLQPLS